MLLIGETELEASCTFPPTKMQNVCYVMYPIMLVRSKFTLNWITLNWKQENVY